MLSFSTILRIVQCSSQLIIHQFHRQMVPFQWTKSIFFISHFHSTETIHLAVIAKWHLESHYSSAKLDGRVEKDEEGIQELSQSVFQERQPNKTSQTEWNTLVTLTQGQRHSFHWDILVLNPAFFFFYFLGTWCKSLDSADSACWLFSRGRKFLRSSSVSAQRCCNSLAHSSCYWRKEDSNNGNLEILITVNFFFFFNFSSFKRTMTPTI